VIEDLIVDWGSDMASELDPGSSPELEIIELLAREAPSSEFEELVRRNRRALRSAEAVERIEHAAQLALRVRELAARRRQREAGLAALVDTAHDLAQLSDLKALLKVIARRGRLLLGLDMSWISLHEPDSGDSYVHTADGTVTALTIGFRVPSDAGAGARAEDSNAPFWTSDYLADDKFPHSPVIDAVVRAEGLNALIAVPLRVGDSTVGTLYASDRNMRHFSAEEVGLMRSLANLAAVAIDRARTQDTTTTEIDRLSASDSASKSSLGALREVTAAESSLIDAVLAGEDLQSLAEAIEDALGSPIRICTPDNRTLADSSSRSAPVPGDTGPARQAGADDGSQLTRAAIDAHSSQQPVQLDDGSWVVAIRAGNESLGFLITRPGRQLQEDDLLLLQRAAQVACFQQLLSRSNAVTEHQLRDEILDDLLAVPPRRPEQLRERALHLGVDLNEPHVVVVATPQGGSYAQAVTWVTNYARRLGGMKSTRSGALVLLLPGGDPGDQGRIVNEGISRFLGHPITVGAARAHQGPVAVGQAYREAVRCRDALIALGRVGATASAEELGFIGVLLSGNRDIEGYVKSVIGPVLDYDTSRLTDLAATLQAYFDSSASPTRAAESLHVHPNTVSRRLERITELLGPHWQQPARALEVQLALQLHRARRTLAADPDQARIPRR
jgi:DNA-binding PucR family transcriptional regulator